ncbi:hypothetical protein ACO0QE_004055 [Hanseniaspora vineae]
MKASLVSLGAKFKFSRTKSHRDAMLRNLTSQVFQHNAIITTITKCTAVQQWVERCITFAKKRNSGSVKAKQFYTEKLLQKVFFKGENKNLLRGKLDLLATDTYKNRKGGFTRIIKLEPRPFDKVPMAMVELVDLPIFNKVHTAKQVEAEATEDGADNVVEEITEVVNKGNMKLWMLLRTVLMQEQEGLIKPLTLQNLNKMIALKNKTQVEEFFFQDLLKMRRVIRENNNEAFNEAEELEKLKVLKEKVFEFQEQKKLQKDKYFKGYNKLTARPDWQKDVQIAANY